MSRNPVVFFAVAALVSAAFLAGCEQPPEVEPPEPGPDVPAAEAAPEPAGEAVADEPDETGADRLAAILADQPEEVQARYQYRNPQQTLEFFGIEPGMTVVEALPGRGWYSRILLPYLGDEGVLIGANYNHEMWPKFGFFDDEFIEQMETWVTDWPQEAQAWHGDDGAAVEAFEFGAMPAQMEGRADAVLLVRALHNLARFEDDGGYLTEALDEAWRALKPGGILGVVQHEARPEMPDEWADGRRGYLKKQFVIDHASAAGFEFEESSPVNENPADRPGQDDVVWRLPPSYITSAEDPDLRAEMEAIGESNRMTLRFRKPE